MISRCNKQGIAKSITGKKKYTKKNTAQHSMQQWYHQKEKKRKKKERSGFVLKQFKVLRRKYYKIPDIL